MIKHYETNFSSANIQTTCKKTKYINFYFKLKQLNVKNNKITH